MMSRHRPLPGVSVFEDPDLGNGLAEGGATLARFHPLLLERVAHGVPLQILAILIGSLCFQIQNPNHVHQSKNRILDNHFER